MEEVYKSLWTSALLIFFALLGFFFFSYLVEVKDEASLGRDAVVCLSVEKKSHEICRRRPRRSFKTRESVGK